MSSFYDIYVMAGCFGPPIRQHGASGNRLQPSIREFRHKRMLRGGDDTVRSIMAGAVDDGSHIVGIHFSRRIGRQERLEPRATALAGIEPAILSSLWQNDWHSVMEGPHEFRVHVRTNDPLAPEKVVRVLSDWVK